MDTLLVYVTVSDPSVSLSLSPVSAVAVGTRVVASPACPVRPLATSRCAAEASEPAASVQARPLRARFRIALASRRIALATASAWHCRG